MAAALGGVPLPIHGDGGPARDFTFVDSVTAVITKVLLDRIGYPEPVNLAFGSRVSLVQLVAVLEDVLGHPVEIGRLDPRAGDVRDSQADTERLRSLIAGVDPVPLSLNPPSGCQRLSR